MPKPEPLEGKWIAPPMNLLQWVWPADRPPQNTKDLAYRHATFIENGRHAAVAAAAIVRSNPNKVPGQLFLIGLQYQQRPPQRS